MKTFEIFFTDLNDDAQQELLALIGVDSPKEMNWDIPIVPLATLEFEEDI